MGSNIPTSIPPEDLRYLELSSTRLSGSGDVGAAQVVERYSLQSMVELVYLKHANDLLASTMGQLDVTLTTSQAALSVLTDIQTLHNKVSIPNVPTFSAVFPFRFDTVTQKFSVPAWKVYTFSTAVSPPILIKSTIVYVEPKNMPLGVTGSNLGTGNQSYLQTINAVFDFNSPEGYASAYNKLSKAYYEAIDPIVAGAITAGDVAAMAQAKTNLNNYIRALSGLKDPMRSGVVALMSRLSAVLVKLPDPASQSSYRKWLLDGNDLHGVAGAQNAGAIQSDLNVAITAAQSANSAQNQAVRKFMFTFQQYEQSAAAVLSALQQMFRSISGNISRT